MKKNNLKIDICCVAKNENYSICDWIEYHKNIGINHIWIFDNNNIDDDSLKETVNDFITCGYVTVFDDYKGAKKFQSIAYNKFFSEEHDYDWVGCIDCDEYITLTNPKYKNISDFFSDSNNTFDAIFVNWECYGDNNHITASKEPVVERFPSPLNDGYHGPHARPEWIKSFTKNGVKRFYEGENVHACYVESDNYGNGGLKKVTKNDTQEYDYSNIKLRHYITKSLEEYLKRKFQKQSADHGIVYYDMGYYFQINDINDEKIKYINSGVWR